MLSNKPMVHGGRLIIDICYKYNIQKVISFIVTEASGIRKAGLYYLYNFPD